MRHEASPACRGHHEKQPKRYLGEVEFFYSARDEEEGGSHDVIRCGDIVGLPGRLKRWREAYVVGEDGALGLEFVEEAVVKEEAEAEGPGEEAAEQWESAGGRSSGRWR